MNARLLTLLLTLSCSVTLFLGAPSLGHAAPAAPQVEREVDDDPCIQACFDQHIENLRNCKEVCRRCTLSVFGLCLARTTDVNCLEACHAKAEDLYRVCVAACVDA